MLKRFLLASSLATALVTSILTTGLMNSVGVQQLQAQVPPCIVMVYCIVTPYGSECWEVTICG